MTKKEMKFLTFLLKLDKNLLGSAIYTTDQRLKVLKVVIASYCKWSKKQ